MTELRDTSPQSERTPWYFGRSPPLAKRLFAPRGVGSYVRQILAEGLAVIPGSLPPAKCDSLVAEFTRATERYPSLFQRDRRGHFPRIVNPHVIFPSLFEAFSQNRKTRTLCDYMFGAETVVYSSLYYESGSQQDVHRDTPYFWTRPGYRYFGVWVALEDTDLENGPLIVIRGGHKLPEADLTALRRAHFPDGTPVEAFAPGLWNAYQSEVQRACEAAGLKVEPVTVKKGDTIVWHPHLPHGGAAIADPARTRHSLVFHVVPVGTMVHKQDVFFDPASEAPARIDWAYRTHDGRRFIDIPTMSVAHRRELSAADFAAADTRG